MPDTTLTTLAIATGGAFLGKFVGPAAEAIGKAAWERAQQLGAKATAYLGAVGREPQPVELKILLPLAQAAGLETNATLSDLWAALLANAADPAQKIQAQLGFVEVLRQLTPTDAQVLDFIYAEHPAQEGDLFCHHPTVEDVLCHFEWQALTTEISLGNLSRLRLFDFASGSLYTADNSLNTKQRFLFTAYGGQFIEAVTPPTP